MQVFTRKKSNCRILPLIPPPMWDNVQDVVSTIVIIHATKFKRICTFFHSPCSIQTLLLPLIFIRKFFALFSFHLRYIFALKRRQSEVLSKTKRRSIEHLSKTYRTSIEDLSKTYRREHVATFLYSLPQCMSVAPNHQNK